LNVGTSCTMTWNTLAGYSSGVAYPLKLVTVDGAVFSYSAICGSTS